MGRIVNGGEWQKVAIARAYMRDGDVLILDEPTAAPDARARIHILVLAREKAVARASNGMSLPPDLDFAEAGRVFSTVLVAGGPSLPDRPGDTLTTEWLRTWSVRAGRYRSICTGAFVLGHAGLLDGRAVTTHWQNAARLAAMFPLTRVEHDRIQLQTVRS